jgi:transposase-like protein
MSGHGRKNGRDAAVLALAGGDTVAVVARKAGVAERTLYRWRGEEDFGRAVAQARAEMFGRALGYLADGAVSGALVLRQLCLKATSETVKLGAARALLELGARLRESVELEARLAALEESLAAQGGRPR